MCKAVRGRIGGVRFTFHFILRYAETDGDQRRISKETGTIFLEDESSGVIS